MAEDLEEQNKEESKGSERKEERKKINPLALIKLYWSSLLDSFVC